MSVGTLAQILAELGDVRVVLAGTIFIVAFLIWHRQRDIAGAFACGVVLCILATVALKLTGLILARLSISSLIGSPSGHVALGTVFAGSLGLVLSHNRGLPAYAAGLIGTMLAVLAIAHSRVANDAHSGFEVLEGAAMGVIGLIPLAALMLRRTQAAIPAWPPILVIAVLVAAVFPMRELDTEMIVRRIADWLPITKV